MNNDVAEYSSDSSTKTLSPAHKLELTIELLHAGFLCKCRRKYTTQEQTEDGLQDRGVIKHKKCCEAGATIKELLEMP
jgi:hypothetical protein